MEKGNIVLNGLINGLKIGSKMLESLRKESTNNVEKFELVNKQFRHFYEKSSDVILEAKTKVGTISKKNECYDSFVVKSHPQNDEYKLLVLTSGYGSVELGKKENISSSEFVALTLEDWFVDLSGDSLESFSANFFGDSLNKLLRKADHILREKGNCGVKAIMALIGPKFTYISNIGDLRCYLDDGNIMMQYNEEDSYLWECYRNGYFYDKEEFRFSRMKDINVGMLGVNNEKFASSYLIESTEFENLYLFSRGVIESISEDEMFDIRNKVSNNGRVVEAFVSHSTNGKKEYMCNFEGENSSEILPVVRGEKDATVCSYIKVLKK